MTLFLLFSLKHFKRNLFMIHYFVLLGQLGDVMKESANLAMNWVKSHASQVCQNAVQGTKM